MSGLKPKNGSPKEFRRYNRFQLLRDRLLRSDQLFIIQRYGYKIKNIIMWKLKKMLPTRRYKGILWVPMNVPMSQRLETLAIFSVAFCATVMPSLAYALLVKLLYSQLWWLGLIYMLYLLHDQDIASHGGRRWDSFRNWSVHRYLARYFPVKLVKTAELNPTKNYIAPTCPRGHKMLAATVAFSTNGVEFDSDFPGLKSYMAMTPEQFKVPFLRDLNLAIGGVTGSEESISYLMGGKYRGNFVCVNLGGTSEANEARNDVYNVVVKTKKEYARIALKTGASIVPVFCFGETKAYKTNQFPQGTWLRTLQDKISVLTGIVPIAARGRGFFQYNFGIIPFRTPITVVVGEPIAVRQIHEPTEEEVDALHEVYMQKLVHFFEKHKHKYEPDPNIKLVLK